MMEDTIHILSRERPVGSKGNVSILEYLKTELINLNFRVCSLPFSCNLWEAGDSYLKLNNDIVTIKASPFSMPFEGQREIAFAASMGELEQLECSNCILMLSGSLTATPLQPKDYPFYYPDEHRTLISLLEQKQPAVIIAATGRHPLCGLSPFPLFEDGNFLIPSAYVSEHLISGLRGAAGTRSSAYVCLRSGKISRVSYQLIAAKRSTKSAGKIVICAHMDSKYNTPGALDNAAGVAVLLEAAKRIHLPDYDIDIVPFNGEEYYGAGGEIEYLTYLEKNQERPVLVINIDSPCHIGSEIAVSFYNFADDIKQTANRIIALSPKVVSGSEWYAGDHAVFAFRGTPCIVLTSSDLFSGGLNHTHTMDDTLETVDISLVEYAVEFIVSFLSAMPHKEQI